MLIGTVVPPKRRTHGSRKGKWSTVPVRLCRPGALVHLLSMGSQFSFTTHQGDQYGPIESTGASHLFQPQRPHQRPAPMAPLRRHWFQRDRHGGGFPGRHWVHRHSEHGCSTLVFGERVLQGLVPRHRGLVAIHHAVESKQLTPPFFGTQPKPVNPGPDCNCARVHNISKNISLP